MSVSPAQNFSKPPPVPDSPTVILTSGFSSLEQLGGCLCERERPCDEPSMAILPERSVAARRGRCRCRRVAARGRPECEHAAAAKNDEERRPHFVTPSYRFERSPQARSARSQSVTALWPSCEKGVNWLQARREPVAEADVRVDVVPPGQRRSRASRAACGRRRRPSGRRGAARAPHTSSYRAARARRSGPRCERSATSKLELTDRERHGAAGREHQALAGPDRELTGLHEPALVGVADLHRPACSTRVHARTSDRSVNSM